MADPSWRCVPAHDGTYGDIAADVGGQLGLEPDEDQRAILDAIFAYRSERPDTLAAFESAVVAPRQNLKTATLEVAALTELFVFRVPLHVWTAHLFKTSRSSFLHMVQMIDGNDEYRRLCRKPRTANNQEAITLLTGEEIQFYARSSGGGRGITAGRVTLDEALFLQPADMGALLPTLATIEGAQVRYGSSGCMLQSSVLRGVRDRGRAGVDPSLVYFEWAAERRPCASDQCSHAFGVDGCALDDEELWAQANPALGRRITIETLRKFRRSMPAEEFAREFLTWHEDPEEIADGLDFELWESCQDRESKAETVDGWAVAPARDLSWCSISMVGCRADGRKHLEVVEYRKGTHWVADRLVALQAAHGGTKVALEAKGPRSTLLDDLTEVGCDPTLMSVDDMVGACGRLFDGLLRDRVRHLGQAELDVSVRGAARRLVGDDGWVWSRRASTVEISPLVAQTMALWVAHLDVDDEPGVLVSL